MGPVSIQVALWGLVAGGALPLGAALGWFLHLPQRFIAGVMAFGSGVLISALAFELMDKAYQRGGFDSTALGFLSGAIVFTAANWALSRHAGKHRKRSGPMQRSEEQYSGSGAAIAVGALLDGVPESAVIGLSFLDGGTISVATLVAITLANVPEAMASAAGMKHAGRSRAYVFGVWGAIGLASGIGAWIGYAGFHGVSEEIVAAAIATAAGAILAMLADTMIPEAFDEAHEAAGLITVCGFLTAFAFSKLVG